MSERDYNGEPGCRSPAELSKSYRHYWDPTAYWQCSKELGEAAQLKRCPANELYHDKAQRCVPWKDWHWTEPQEPPTKPRK